MPQRRRARSRARGGEGDDARPARDHQGCRRRGARAPGHGAACAPSGDPESGEREGCSFRAVSADRERGGIRCAPPGAGRGPRRIAYVAGPQDVSTGPSRLRGFMAGLAAGGLDAGDGAITYAASYSIQEGLRCGRALLRGPRRWSAVAAANDMLAVGCYSALEEAGLRCPDDVSVVGFNDMPFIDRLCPPLTSVRFPHYQVGTESAQILLERIGQPGAPAGVKMLFLAPELVVRGSTAPAGHD